MTSLEESSVTGAWLNWSIHANPLQFQSNTLTALTCEPSGNIYFPKSLENLQQHNYVEAFTFSFSLKFHFISFFNCKVS